MLKGTSKTGSGGRKRGDGGGGWFSGWGGGWVWYGVLVLLRWWGAVGPWGWWSGYVHPDEFFQSPEVAAGAVLGHAQLATPWEFHPSFACRSISLPCVPPPHSLGVRRRTVSFVLCFALGSQREAVPGCS
jgi:hypothetical protein